MTCAQCGRELDAAAAYCSVCGARAGVGGRVDCHKFRSTCATRLHAAGMPVQDVQKVLGHRDIKTTLRYLSSTSHESEATGRAVEAAFSS